MLMKAIIPAVLLLELASGSPSAIEKRSFKIDRVANERYSGPNGPRALAKAFRKFGMDLPEGLAEAAVIQPDAPTDRALQKRRNRPFIFQFGTTSVKGQEGNGQKEKKNKKKKNKNKNKGGAGGAAGGAKHGGKGKKAGHGNKQGNNQTGIVAAVPEANDKEFLSPVKIGGQTVTLDFDTGSSDLWVFNTQLSKQITGKHAIYDPTASKTFKELKGASFAVRYGDGSGASGNVGTDVVDLGGAVFDKQAIELATNVSNQFVQDQNNDGLLGLAFSTINTVKPQKQKTFFDNVMPSLSEPVFTADLRKGAAGAYEFGRIDASKFQGEMAWIPIDNKKGFWQFSSESFAVDGGKAQPAARGGQAIADTGTTLILADPTIVEGYYSQIKGAQNNKQVGGITVPCDAKLPDLDLDIGGKYMARVKGADLNFAPVNKNGKSSSNTTI